MTTLSVAAESSLPAKNLSLPHGVCCTSTPTPPMAGLLATPGRRR